MLRLLAAALLLAAPILAAPAHAAKAAARPDWLATVVATPEGGYRVGNPAAKVKLVEYGSLTCPHCRAFQAEAMTALRTRWIATGKASFEFRSFVLNGPDYAASLLIRCGGAAKALPLVDALYAQQNEWVKPFAELDPAATQRLASLEPQAQVAALAKLGKLDAFVVARGVPASKIDACLADKAAFDRLATLRDAATSSYNVTGTPGFVINGKLQTEDFLGQPRQILTWDKLEPRLVAASR